MLLSIWRIKAGEMADIRKWDGSIHPTIKGPMAYYVRQLLGTGLYGLNAAEVVRTLLREGIRQAAKDGFVQLKRFDQPTDKTPQ
jgi:hypothetical protein